MCIWITPLSYERETTVYTNLVGYIPMLLSCTIMSKGDSAEELAFKCNRTVTCSSHYPHTEKFRLEGCPNEQDHLVATLVKKDDDG